MYGETKRSFAGQSSHTEIDVGAMFDMILTELEEITRVLEEANALERRKADALELRGRVELLKGWGAYKAAGGSQPGEALAKQVAKLYRLLAEEADHD